MTMLDQLRPSLTPAQQRLLALTLPVVVAVALAGVGAFGSYVVMGLPLRLLHFITVAIAIGALSFGLSMVLSRYVFAGPLPPWATVAVAIAITPAGGLIVQSALYILAPHVLRHVTFIELMQQVVLINLTVGAGHWLLARRPDAPVAIATAIEADEAGDAAQELRTKLPAAQRQARILALSAEDHYLRVHTDQGQALILMNLSRAIDLLGPGSGVRIHRSHWVANELAELTPGRSGIRLDRTTVFPVSRAGRKLLKARQTDDAPQRVGTGFSPR